MKKIIIPIVSLVAVIAICLTTILIINNTGLNGFKKDIKKSMDSVKIVETNVNVTDQNVTVYKHKQVVEIAGSTANFTTTESELTSNFDLVDNVREDVFEDFNKNNLFKFNIDKSLIDSLVLDKNNLSGEISHENIKKVLNNNEIEISGKASLKITLEDKKINFVEIIFNTTTSKEVVVTVKYSY